MTPEAIIADLDAALEDTGEDVRLQRLTAGPSGTQIPFEVICRARVVGVGTEKLIAGISQNQHDVVISPTEIIKKGWPGPATSAAAAVMDRHIPVKGDRMFIKNVPCNVEIAHGKYVSGELVRINIRASGT